ncbi:MAG: hypothetical protein WCT42_03985 [Candidatus Paceibacterota bacterium]
MEFVTENKSLFDEYRAEYPLFTYDKYEWVLKDSVLTLSYTYSFSDDDIIKSLIEINLPEQVKEEEIRTHEDYIFRIGLINALSYWKAYCSPNLSISCGVLSDFELSWWKNLWYDGLGEFRYRNGLIDVTKDNWVEITSSNKEELNNLRPHNFEKLDGNLIAFTGGKDSTLVLGMFKETKKEDNEIFVINPLPQAEKIKEILGVISYPQTTVLRTVNNRLIEINNLGALNGHTPFSAIVSFVGVFVASLRNKKYFIVANESSANEVTVSGTNINHQYSKSITFEKSFQEYCNNLWPGGPSYVSILRPITEIGIACMLKKYESVVPYISSCNVVKRTDLWCGKCPKCFFASLLFSAVWDIPFATKTIGTNMFDNVSNMDMLCELTGIAKTKPFECIGTRDESRAILSKIYTSSKAMDEPLLKEFWTLHHDILPKSEKFTEIAKEFHEHLLPENLAAIIINAQKEII